MFARFDENPAMTLQDIKETKRYGWTHTRTDVKTVYRPPQTKFAGGIIKKMHCTLLGCSQKTYALKRVTMVSSHGTINAACYQLCKQV